MKAILMSMQPYYYYLTAIAKTKTIEVRKTEPKERCPVFMYVSKNKQSLARVPAERREEVKTVMCKIPATFRIGGIMGEGSSLLLKRSCLTEEELHEYANGKSVYGWRIADLQIFDEPKKLSEFRHNVRGHRKSNGEWAYVNCCLTRPPQSWQYVEVSE